MENQEPLEMTIISSSENYGALEKAQIDIQISTAKNYPRSIDKFVNSSIAMVTRNREIAEACQYSLPVGGKTVKGKSVRLAEILMSCYQNIKGAGRVIGNDGRFITVEFAVIDTENNISISMPVVRSIRKKTGEMFDNHLIMVTTQAALSIAKRNAILSIIPQSLSDEVSEAARKVVIGSPAELPVRRAKMLEYFQTNYKVNEDRILKKLGKVSLTMVDGEDIATLIGYMNAINSNETSIDDIFPTDKPTAQNESQEKATSALKNTANKVKSAAEKAKGKEAEPEVKAEEPDKHGIRYTIIEPFEVTDIENEIILLTEDDVLDSTDTIGMLKISNRQVFIMDHQMQENKFRKE